MVDYGVNKPKNNKDDYVLVEEEFEEEFEDEEIEEVQEVGNYLKNYPIIAITGDFGSGKTLLSTYIALKYHVKEGLKIFANYEFIGVNYRKVTFEEVSKMPKWLNGGVLVLDEAQIGADSYNFNSKKVQKITTFITQIRKRDIILIITTQRFNMVAKRIRLLINYYIEVSSSAKGIVDAKTFDITGGFETLLNVRKYNLRPFYNYYDTTEVIRDEE